MKNDPPSKLHGKMNAVVADIYFERRLFKIDIEGRDSVADPCYIGGAGYG